DFAGFALNFFNVYGCGPDAREQHSQRINIDALSCMPALASYRKHCARTHHRIQYADRLRLSRDDVQCYSRRHARWKGMNRIALKYLVDSLFVGLAHRMPHDREGPDIALWPATSC